MFYFCFILLFNGHVYTNPENGLKSTLLVLAVNVTNYLYTCHKVHSQERILLAPIDRLLSHSILKVPDCQNYAQETLTSELTHFIFIYLEWTNTILPQSLVNIVWSIYTITQYNYILNVSTMYMFWLSSGFYQLSFAFGA